MSKLEGDRAGQPMRGSIEIEKSVGMPLFAPGSLPARSCDAPRIVRYAHSVSNHEPTEKQTVSARAARLRSDS